MSSPRDVSAADAPATVTAALLRRWPLPEPGDSKYSRGRIAVVGGSEQSPGAVALAGLSALRVGAGRLSLHVPRSVAVQLAVAVPEAGVVSLEAEKLPSEAVEDLKGADAVLIGPGLTDADTTRRLLHQVFAALEPHTAVVLDAFALGVLVDMRDGIRDAGNPLILTPNREEAARLLDTDNGGNGGGDNSDGDDGRLLRDVSTIAAEYQAVVSCYGAIAAPSGQRWMVSSDNPGLATSGSGDVLAGAVLGLAARCDDTAQAAVWATFLHADAGAALARRVGALGFLAREISDELARALDRVNTDADAAR